MNIVYIANNETHVLKILNIDGITNVLNAVHRELCTSHYMVNIHDISVDDARAHLYKAGAFTFQYFEIPDEMIKFVRDVQLFMKPNTLYTHLANLGYMVEAIELSLYRPPAEVEPTSTSEPEFIVSDHDRAILRLLNRVNTFSLNNVYRLVEIVHWVGEWRTEAIDQLLTDATLTQQNAMTLSQLDLANMYPSMMKPIWFKLSEIKPSDHTKSGTSDPVLVRINGKIFNGYAHFHNGQWHSMSITGLKDEVPCDLSCYDYDTRLDEVEWTNHPLNGTLQACLPSVETRKQSDIPEGEKFVI